MSRAPFYTLSPLSTDKSYVGHILNETVIIHCVASTIHFCYVLFNPNVIIHHISPGLHRAFVGYGS